MLIKFCKRENTTRRLRKYLFSSYTSVKYFSTSTSVSDVRERLIKSALLNVNKYGWSELSIKTAANELGYSNNLSSLLEKGELDLVYYTMDNWNKKLKADLEEIKKNNFLSLDEKYLKAIKLRLSYEIPLMNTWPQAIRLGMSPGNIKETMSRLIEMVNEICSLDNSDSPDLSYSKKYLILKIFLLSEFYMTTDKSHNFTKTWDFVDKIYSFNFNIYSGLSNFFVVNSALFTVVKYSLISFLPYDLSQVEEMMKKKEEVEVEEINKHHDSIR